MLILLVLALLLFAVGVFTALKWAVVLAGVVWFIALMAWAIGPAPDETDAP